MQSRLLSLTGVLDAEDCLAKVLAGHFMLEAAMEVEAAAAASRSRLSGSLSPSSDSDFSDSDADGEQPFAPRTPSGSISSGLAQRLARLQLAMEVTPPEALRCMLKYCIEVSNAGMEENMPCGMPEATSLALASQSADVF